MAAQLVRPGIWLPRREDLEATSAIQEAQIRRAPLTTEGKVDRAAWEAQRNESIGASDVATLLGTEYGTRQSPFSLYWSKKGKYQKAFKDTTILELGHQAEYEADLKFLRTTRDMALTDPFSAGIRWALHPRLVASIDRVLFLDQDEDGQQMHSTFDDITRTKQWIPVEIKRIGEFMEGEWGTSYIPQNYYDQVQAQLLATGKTTALVIAMYAREGADVTRKGSEVYTVSADPTRMQLIREAVPEFLDRLDNDDPPEPDGTEASTECVKVLTKKAETWIEEGPKGGKKKKGKTIPASPEMIQNVEALFHAQDQIEWGEIEEVRRENLIRMEMGDATKCSHLMFTVLYSEVENKVPVMDTEAAEKNEAYTEAKKLVEELQAKLKDAAAKLNEAAAPFITINTTMGRRLLVQKPKG